MSATQTETTNVSDLTKPWTVKNVSWEDRNAAISAADRSKQTIGEWLSRAIRAQVQEDAGKTRSTAIITTPPPPPAAEKATNDVDIDALSRLVSIAHTISDDARPIDPVLRKRVISLVKQGLGHLRATSRKPKSAPPAV